MASVTTGQNDYTQKRDDYAAFGVPEYWRFDPSGGEYHDAPLAGDHLVDGVYQPIEVVQFGETTYRGHSTALGWTCAGSTGISAGTTPGAVATC